MCCVSPSFVCIILPMKTNRFWPYCPTATLPLEMYIYLHFTLLFATVFNSDVKKYKALLSLDALNFSDFFVCLLFYTNLASDFPPFSDSEGKISNLCLQFALRNNCNVSNKLIFAL